MQRCLQLAEKGKGSVAPNPMVGAVLVYENRIIGEGWHQEYGSSHAEVNCINSVAEHEKQLIPKSTLYVSLEPCAHHGKTPPCSLRIIQEKIKKVVVCNDDPFEKVSGKGYELLKEAGVHVTTGFCNKIGQWVNRRFFCFHQKKRPYIILKWAQTANGYMAPIDRSRKNITDDTSQELVHQWRTEEASILVGHTTALQDNPKLTARLVNGKQPLRITLDKDLQLPLTHHLFDDEASTWILNQHKQEVKRNISWMQIDFAKDIWQQIFTLLYRNQVPSILIEGGPYLLNTLIAANLWDEARVLSSSTIWEEGITAPQLHHAHLALATQLKNDRLTVYTHEPLQYCSGYSL